MVKQTKFLGEWISMLWHAMAATGNGYKRDSLKRTGRGDDRRNDKLRMVESLDAYEKPKVEYVPFASKESKIQRRARLGRIGAR